MNVRLVLAAVAGVYLAACAWTPRAWSQGAILHKTGPIQVSQDGQQFWCVNPDHDSVTKFIDGGTFYNSAQIFLPNIGQKHNPRGLSLRPGAHEIWIPTQNSDRVYVYDTMFNTIITTLFLPTGSGAASIVFSPDGSLAIVSCQRSASLVVFDAATRALIQTVPVFRRPNGMSFTSNPNELWVTHTLPEGDNSYVSVVDTTTWKVKSFIEFRLVNPRTTGQVQDDPVPIAEGGYILFRGHFAQPPGSTDIWFPCQYHNFLNDVMTADSTIQSAIHKVNLSTYEHYLDNRAVVTAVYAHNNSNVLLGDGWNARVSGPIDVAYDAAGTTAYIVHNSSNDVLVVPTGIGLTKPMGSQPLTEIGVGEAPIGIAASPISPKLYVVNYLGRSVSVIDTTTNTVSATLLSTPFTPDPVPANVRAGARIFNTSADSRTSVNEKVSCASCHPDGDTDGFPWEFAQFGVGTRATLTLFGQALTIGPQVGGRGQLHRGGDRDEVQDFDFTFRTAFMNATGFLPGANPPLGTPNSGLSTDLDNMSAFVLSLSPLRNSPYRAPDGSLTASQVRGAELFKSTTGPYATNCATCHIPPTFTDMNFHNVGGVAPAPEFQGPEFNTPTLVGAWDHPPYKQTAGAVSTDDFFSLSSVLRATNARTGLHGNTSGLNRVQLRDLENFLFAIDGRMADEGIAAVIDAAPPRVVEVRPISLNAVQVVFDETVDEATAEDISNYSLSDGIRAYAPSAAVLDTVRGNIVTLSVALRYYGCPVTYTLTPGPVQDVAGAVSGGANNSLDTADPTNARSFVLNGFITVTFGDTGNETFTSVSQDASFNSTLSTTSHHNIRLYAQPAIPSKGFLKFDFVPALTSVCGVTDPAAITDARFSLVPKLGYTNTIEFRRCFQPWNEPPRDACVACAGAVTRQHSTYNTLLWRQSGARAVGGSGTGVSEYYPTNTFDTAATSDLITVVEGIGSRQEFSSPAILDAFRFWFANPSVNFGYAVSAMPLNFQGTEFWADEAENGRHGSVLTITFAVAPQTGDDCDMNGAADDCQILANAALDANSNGVLDDCEPGACCVQGVCQQLTLPACNAAGGTFFGIGVDCAAVTCPPPTGACCLNSACSVVSQAACTQMGGTYQGDGSVCTPNPCPCRVDYNHDGIVTSQDFFDFLGDFFLGAGDYNQDGMSTSQDFFDFITDFFVGCAP
ncbi:MAG: hypothetical protein AB7G11_06865 [Phycisphaerales bacterium]